MGPTIVEAAIRTENGSIYRGKRHGDAIRAAIAAKATKRCTSEMQGFVTSDGEFVNRHKAAELAIKAGQVKFLMFPGLGLTSEDLY